MTPRTLVVFAFAMLAGGASGCDHPRGGDEVAPIDKAQERVEETRAELDQASRKVIEATEDFVEARSAFSRAAHDRIERIDRRLLALEQETDRAAKQAAVELRQQRDVIATKLRSIDASAQADFQTLKGEVAGLLDELEHRAGVR